MPGTPCAEVFASLEALPADAAPLFDAARSFLSTLAWWEAVLGHAMPPGGVARFVLIRQDGAAPALFPMVNDPAHRSLTTPYTCLFEPLLAANVTDRASLFTAFARSCRGFSTTRLDALDQTLADDLTLASKTAGLAVARFDHFGNWHEDITGLDWTAYLSRRPGALRETIRRRTRRAERLDGAAFRLFIDLTDLETGITAFETVYARSWKEPEPHPSFNPAQIRAAAAMGIARLGVWWINGAPAAAQFWIVEHGQATVLKLAHDETFRAHSPGTVLTAWMIRHMIEREHVTSLDFGRGDDPYKKDWAASRRQRAGLLLINPRLPGGMLALTRHLAGRARSRLRTARAGMS